jgi:GntR family transcriptional regulator / MocR family aminotransferase
MIPLSDSGIPLKTQIYAGLKDAIVSGRLAAGSKLPSTRALANDLGVSRKIVVLAFEQLHAEGYIEARGGSGTYVARTLRHPKTAASTGAEPVLSVCGETAVRNVAPLIQRNRNTAVRYDFAINRSNLALFPFQAWRRILVRYAQSASVRAYDYSSPAGSMSLRESIAQHLGRARGVRCHASQIVIVSGAQQALDLACRILLDRGDRAVIEDPHYPGTREVLRCIGATLHPVPIDADGLVTTDLPKSAKIAVVTPSDQFPTGMIMSPSRRLELLQWAKKANAFILEDDYDGECRHSNRTPQALQSVDEEGRVIYVGSFSRTMFSSMRIGYVVLPHSLVIAFEALKWLADRHTPTLEQEALAEFIRSGRYDRHLLHLRRHNAHSSKLLAEAIARHLPSEMRVSRDLSGERVVLWLPPELPEHEVVARAETLGVRVSGLSRYFLSPRSRRPGLLLGYVRLNDSQIVNGMRLLGQAIRDVASGAPAEDPIARTATTPAPAPRTRNQRSR